MMMAMLHSNGQLRAEKDVKNQQKQKTVVVDAIYSIV